MHQDLRQLLSEASSLRRRGRAVRSRSIGTKLTEAEYGALAARAGDQKLSEWVRAQLLKEEPDPEVAALLSELIGLRTIVVNVIFALANGNAITVDAMQGLIDRADEEKMSKANARLALVRARHKR